MAATTLQRCESDNLPVKQSAYDPPPGLLHLCILRILILTFKHTNETATSYAIIHRLPAVRTLELQFPAQCSEVAEAYSPNGKPATWTLVEGSICRLATSVVIPVSSDEKVEINIEWGGGVSLVVQAKSAG